MRSYIKTCRIPTTWPCWLHPSRTQLTTEGPRNSKSDTESSILCRLGGPGNWNVTEPTRISPGIREYFPYESSVQYSPMAQMISLRRHAVKRNNLTYLVNIIVDHEHISRNRPAPLVDYYIFTKTTKNQPPSSHLLEFELLPPCCGYSCSTLLLAPLTLSTGSRKITTAIQKVHESRRVHEKKYINSVVATRSTLGLSNASP